MNGNAKAAPKTKFFAEERKQKIMEMLDKQQKIVIPELCSYFDISPATIRNDLNELQESGLLTRTHGGALLNTQVSSEKVFVKNVEHLAEKRAFAEYALTHINDADTLVLDAGTTTSELAKLLWKRKRLTLVVNDIQIAQILEGSSDANIVLIGGYLRKGIHCAVGPMATRALADLKVDKAFIATNGITIDGLSTPDMYQAEVKKAMIRIANQVIVMADSSKFGVSSFQNFARIEDVDVLITDDKVDGNELAKYRERCSEVTVLPVP